MIRAINTFFAKINAPKGFWQKLALENASFTFQPKNVFHSKLYRPIQEKIKCFSFKKLLA